MESSAKIELNACVRYKDTPAIVAARRAGCVTNASASSRCCTKDGRRPFEADLQE